MAETHELRLKINAAAARAGSREFVGAIQNVKRAVIELERTSSGAFKRLSKNTQEAGKAAKIKIQPVDRTAIRNLNDFAKAQFATIRQAASSSKGIATLTQGLLSVAGSYATARTAGESYATSLNRANTALARQAQLLSQVSAASRSSGPRSSPQAGAQISQTDQAAQQQVAMQNRIQRSVDNSRLSVERLVTQLMKLGGFSQLNSVTRAFRDFQKEVSRSSITTTEFDAAKTRLNSSLKSAQTAVVTLTTKEQENARATREAAAAARAHEAAARQQAASQRESATASTQSSTALDRQRGLYISSAIAVQRATEETARLTERMRRVGDTRGIAALNSALNNLRSSVGNSVSSTLRFSAEMAKFSATASNTKISLTQMEGTQRRAAESARVLAARQRDASNEARRMEREMRSVAGASSAASRAFRQATGSMRGLENAFSGTFQIGSAFRTMLGTITFGTFIREVFSAGATLQQFTVTMQVATGSIREASEQMDFIDGMARELGTNLRTSREDFSKFAVSANLAGVETATARDIFRSVSQAMTVMGRGAEDQRLAFLALEQMLSKNVVSSEELRRQLGERLPGAVNLMARAVGVSTQELQKMLKAGELISAEVLPKFAREVDLAFGPGLEASLERAPAALGRFRNELEFFLATIANSGFMLELADSFDILTQALRSEEMNGVAQKLGAGLSDLVKIGTSFATSLVDNIETVGRVAKAVIGGLIVRQLMLLGNAAVTSIQRAAIGFSTLAASMGSNTAASAANTTSITTNTQARRFSSAQLAATSAALAANSASLGANTAASAANAATQTRLGAAFATAGSAAAAAGRGMGIASRVLGGLAGPVGLAITALSLIPLLFSDTGDGADEMVNQIEAAIRRAGVSFDQFERQAARATSSIRLMQTLADIKTLESAVAEFRQNSRQDIVAISLAFEALDKNIDLSYNRALPGIQILEELFGKDAVFYLNKILGATRATVAEVIGAAKQAIESGRGFLALRGQIAETISVNPSTAVLLEPIMKLTEQLALAEAGSVRLRMGLVDVYGTKNERLLKRFADTASAVVRTGEGVEDLRGTLRSMAGDTPELADDFEKIFDSVVVALKSGVGVEAFGASVISIFDGGVKAVENMRQAVADAELAVSDSTSSMRKEIERFSDKASGVPGTSTFGMEVAEGIKDASRKIRNFQDFNIGVDRIQTIFNGFKFPSAEAREFGEAVITAFKALPQGLQTYQRLNDIISQLQGSYDDAGPGAEAFSDALRSSIIATKDNSFSLSDYIDLLEKYRSKANSAGARSYIDSLIKQAEALRQAKVAQQGATHTLETATAEMRNSTPAISASTEALRAYEEIYDRLGASSSEAQGALNAALGQSFEQFDLSQLSGADADVAQYFSSFGPGGRLVAEARGELDALRAEVNGFLRDTGSNLPDGAINDLLAQIAAQEQLINQFIRQREMLIRAQSMGPAETSDSALLSAIQDVTTVLPRFSSATQQVVEETIVAARTASESGGGFIELRAQIDQAMQNAPSAEPLLAQLRSVIDAAATTEESIVATRLSAQNLFDNTFGDRVAASFAELGARVVTGSANVSDLQEKFAQLIEQSPYLKERLTSIFNEAMRAMESGDESLFLSRIVDLVDQSGVELARLRKDVRLTSVAADDAAAEFANSFTQVSVALQRAASAENGVDIGISEADIILLNSATEEFQRLNDSALSLDHLNGVLESIYFPSADTERFANALAEQFAALPEGERNIANLNAILIQLGRSYPELESNNFVNSLREYIIDTNGASSASAKYIAHLESLRDSMPDREIKELIQGMIDAAQAKRDAAQAAGLAEGAIIAAGQAAATAGAQAAGAANGFHSLADAASVAFATISQVQANVGSALEAANAQVTRQLEIAGMEDRDAFIARSLDPLRTRIDAEIARAREVAGMFSSASPEGLGANARIDELEQERARIDDLIPAYGRLFDVREAGRGGSGGGSGAAAALSEEAQALENLINGVDSHTQSLAAQSAAYALLITRTTSSETAARLLGEAMASGVELTREQTQAIIEQVEAAERLNEQLLILANDPVNEWMDSVPSWIEAGQQIEEQAIRAVSDSFKELLKTGEFSMRALAQSIVGAAIDIIADKAVKSLIGLLGGNVSGEGVGGFGLGQFLGNMFGGADDSGPGSVFGNTGGAEAAAIQAAFTAGGQQAATMIQQALTAGAQQFGVQAQQGMTTGGIQANQQIQMGHQLGGSQAGVLVRTAHASGGSQVGIHTRLAHTQGAQSLNRGVQTGAEIGGSIMAGKIQSAAAGSGVGFGNIFGSLIGLFFSEGGLTSNPSPVNTPSTLPTEMFRNAPSFAKGTPNTSGIPAILHDNEAVVPLSKGRKIPVEMGEGSSGGTAVVNQNITIETPSPREFHNSRTQIGRTLRRAASQGQRIE